MPSETTEIALLRTIVSSLVTHQGDVRITRTLDEGGVLLELHVNPEDMGKVIGREGGTAKAIRTILRAEGMTHQSRVSLKISEPGEKQHSLPRDPFDESLKNL